MSARLDGDGRTIIFDLGNGETVEISGDPQGRVLLIEYRRPWGNSHRVSSFGFRQPDLTALAEAVKRLAKGRPLGDLAGKLDE